MDNQPLVSVLIPNYNKAPYLRKTLDSVLAQTYTHWECIIVDDHSTDDSWKILEEYAKKDSRFKIYQRPDHLLKGGNVCRNSAFKSSKGDLILFLDSDDVLADFCLEQRINTVNSFPSLDFWAFPTVLFQTDVSDAKYYWNVDDPNESDLSRFLRMDALWQTSGCLYKKDFLRNVNGLSPSRKIWQDYELHLKALLHRPSYRKYFQLPPDVFIRNGDPSSLSRSTPFSGDLPILHDRIQLIEEIIHLAKKKRFNFSEIEKNSILSLHLYLIVQLWIKHGEFLQFYKKWLNYGRYPKLSLLVRFLIFLEVIGFKINNRLQVNIPDMPILNLPDLKILEKVQIGIHPLVNKKGLSKELK